MFKEILGRKKRRTLVHDAIDEVLDMLTRAERMFGVVCGGMLASGESGQVDVSQDDKEINIEERIVRRMIFEHLTLNPEDDLPASLALISIVHDVERIGDYCKGLMELHQWDDLCSGESRYAQMCGDLCEMIAPLFPQSLEAMRESDAELARQVMRRHEEIKIQTDQVLAASMGDAEVNRETLLYTLAARLLRRVSAHLSNVVSSVANPLDRLAGKEA